MHLISKLRDEGEVALHSRTGASRLSVPQHTYVPPDHTPSTILLYEAGMGKVSIARAGRCASSEAKNADSAAGVLDGLRVEWTDICVCVALPPIV